VLAQHEAALDGGEDGLEHGRPQQPGLLPLREGRLADAGGGPRLAGDGEDDEIRPLAVVAETATTEATPQLFTGQRYEASSGLYDFRARWYDPEAGRFLSVDPIVQDVADPQTHNAYGYVRNNPVNFVDPDGLGFWKTLWNVVKLVLAAAAIVVAVVFQQYYLAAFLSLTASTINFAQNPSLINGLLLAGSAYLAFGGGNLGTLGSLAGGTIASGGTGADGLLSLAQLGVISEAGGSLVNSAKEMAKSQSTNNPIGPEPGSRAAEIESNPAARIAVRTAIDRSGQWLEYQKEEGRPKSHAGATVRSEDGGYRVGKPDPYVLSQGREPTDNLAWGNIRGAMAVGGVVRGTPDPEQLGRRSRMAGGIPIYIQTPDRTIHVFEHGRAPSVVPP
jgi:RHS repeat-associated protein